MAAWLLGLCLGQLPPAEGAPVLRDLRGNRRALTDFKDTPAFVVLFADTRGPGLGPRAIELEKEFRDRRVKFLAVYPNGADAPDRIAAHAYETGIPFLALQDVDGRFAAALGIERTPCVAALDATHAPRYRGGIDGLAPALPEILAGKPVSAPDTPADGSPINRQSGLPRKEGVTFTRDVAPILQKRCQTCHRPGRIGPFPLLTFENAVAKARMIREVVVQRRMPPWHADERYGHFSNDARLGPDEIAAIDAWVEGGMAPGDPKDLPPPVKWPEGWEVGVPDVIFSIPQEVEVPASGVVPYRHFTTPTEFTEDLWVQGTEIRPGDPSVVHHVLLYVKEKGRAFLKADGSATLLAGWAPGNPPSIVPEGTASRIPKGAELFWEIHYTPTGRATRDRTQVGLVLAKKPPERAVQVNFLHTQALRIPPGDPHHRETTTFRFAEDARLLMLTPHMHRRGKTFTYEALYPDGRTEVLLSVPRWDFNWQIEYHFEKPLAMPKGTRLRATAHFDNSDYNLHNPDPTKAVRWGLQTWEEMMMGFAVYVPEAPRSP